MLEKLIEKPLEIFHQGFNGSWIQQTQFFVFGDTEMLREIA